MAQLVVRGVDERIAQALRVRAAANGRSAEAEHREILRQALDPAEDLKRALTAMPDVGEDRDFDRIQDRGRVVDL